MAGKVFRSYVQISRLQARQIIDTAFSEARDIGMEPLSAVILDMGGNIIAAEREDGCAPLRFPVAKGKAYAALGIGVASRIVGERNEQRPAFLSSVAAASDGQFIPVPGGLVILDDNDCVIGAVGISGASSDEDEQVALAGIRKAGFRAGLAPD